MSAVAVETIVVAGPPNAGKGTWLSVLKERKGDGLRIVSTSALLREEIAAGTKLGMEAKMYMDEGKLVPDNVIINMILEVLKEAEGIVVLDGFPRTKVQAEAMLEAGIVPVKAVEVMLPDEVLIERASDRIICTKCSESYTIKDTFKQPKKEGICDLCGGELKRRADDEPEKVIGRLEDYRAKTFPIFKVLEDAGVDVVYIDRTQCDAKERFFEFIG